MKTEERGTSRKLRKGVSRLAIVLPLAAIALLYVAHSCPADAPASGQTSAPGADSASSTTAGSTALTGKVQKVELNLEKLRDVGLDLKHTLKALSSLYEEVTTQPVSIVTEPEVIGMGTIIYIPVGTQPVGPVQPARKQRVDLEMNAIKPEVTQMKTNVDEFLSGHAQLDLPSDVMSELQPEIKTWVATVENLSGNLAQLTQLTQGPPYDQPDIAGKTVDMQKEIKQLDETRRKIYKVIRKEGKRIAKERKESEKS